MEDAPRLLTEAAAALLVTTTSVPRTDILTEKNGSQQREDVAKIASHPPIPPQPGNFRPPAQTTQLVPRVLPLSPQQNPIAIDRK